MKLNKEGAFSFTLLGDIRFSSGFEALFCKSSSGLQMLGFKSIYLNCSQSWELLCQEMKEAYLLKNSLDK